jgi:peptide subunit release factor 1 (eRF1)
MSDMNELDKHKLSRFLKQLSQYKGRHTELVTVYVPAGYNMDKIISTLSDEQGTASNIKSASTRKNVQAALERMIQHLRTIGRTPPNGIAVFAGNVSEQEGKTNYEVWSFVPPTPLAQKIYRCDKTFVLEPLEKFLETKEVYGLVVMDRREATLALLKGKAIIPLSHASSNVPGKTRAGGQCLIPETLVNIKGKGDVKIEEVEEGDDISSYHMDKEYDFYNKVTKKWSVNKDCLYVIKLEDGKSLECSADHVIFIYDRNNDWSNNSKTRTIKIDKIPAEELKVKDYLLKNHGEKVRVEDISIHKGDYNLIDIEVECGEFFANGVVVHNSSQRFARLREGAALEFFKKVAELMKKEYLMLENLKGIFVGGPGHTKNEFIDKGQITDQVKRKILSIKDVSYTDEFGLQELLEKCQDDLRQEGVAEEKKIVQEFLHKLAHENNKVAYGIEHVKKALDMGAVDTVLLSEDLTDSEVEEFEEKAELFGTDVKIISTDTREGVQLRDLGKAAALLRYPIE